MRCSALVVGCVAVGVGVLVGTSPSGVTPPVVTAGSAAGMLPPWPIFRLAIGLNEILEAAAWATRPPPVQVKSLATAYWQSEIAYSLTKMGIIDATGRSGGITCVAAAKELVLVEDFTCRMMVAGEGIRLLAKKEEKYTLTPAGELLQSEHPGSLRHALLMLNEETKDAWRAVGTDSLKSGISGFKQRYGKEFWEWHSAAAREPKMAQFDAAMRGFSHEIAGSLLLDWAPPAPNATVCDIGGSMGHMVAAMVSSYPELKGVVFDLPQVAKRAETNLESLGLSARVSTLGGSFLEPLPSALSSCDAFYLKFILHDWEDAVCVKILKNIAAVAKPGASIVSTDCMLGVHGPNMEMTKRMMDINMMASNPTGARERTWEQYKALFAQAGIAQEPELIKMRDLVSTAHVTL